MSHQTFLTRTVQCESEADVLLILDSSGSIGRPNYVSLANFAGNLTKHFLIGHDAIQFSAILFSDSVRNLFDFNSFHTNDQVQQALIHMPYLSGSTHTALALDFARTTSFTSAHGTRTNVSKIAIVITDGNSQNHAQTAAAAQRLKDSGVKIIAVGVGSHITTDGDIFNVNDYSVIDDIRHGLITTTCQVALTTPFPTTSTTTTSTTTTSVTTIPPPCSDTVTPNFGTLNCQPTSDGGKECVPQCLPMFQFEKLPYSKYVCSKDGTWTPDIKLVPDCI